MTENVLFIWGILYLTGNCYDFGRGGGAAAAAAAATAEEYMGIWKGAEAGAFFNHIVSKFEFPSKIC